MHSHFPSLSTLLLRHEHGTMGGKRKGPRGKWDYGREGGCPSDAHYDSLSTMELSYHRQKGLTLGGNSWRELHLPRNPRDLPLTVASC